MGARIPAIAGALIVVACGIPFVLWGNPFPPQVLRYWLIGGFTVALAAAFSGSRLATGVRAQAARVGEFVMRPSPPAFALAVAAITVLISISLATYSFRFRASTTDELAMLWHARILLTGHLSLPVDPNREFFALETVVDSGRWYSQFPIGGPLFLVPGVALGAPWLVNPILAGGSAAAVYHFSRRAFGETHGRACGIVFALTPMVVFMAGTWMNHVPVLFLATCALAALVEWERTTSLARAIAYSAVIGLAVAFIATIRPLDAVVVAVVIGLAQVWMLRKLEWRIVRGTTQLAFGAVAVTPLLIANRATTGRALTFGYDVSWGAGHRVGLHADPYGNAHTIKHAAELAMTYIDELNVYLMDWPIPSLAIVVATLFALRRASRWDFLLIGLFAAQVCAYAMYWGEGEFLGPRFLYTALPALAIFVARAPFVIGAALGDVWRRRATALIVASFIVAWCIPAFSYTAVALAKQARGTRASLKIDIKGVTQTAGIHNAVVFLHEPVSSRLARRLWGLGMLRSDAAQLIATRDACSLLAAVRLAESDTIGSLASRLESLAHDAELFVASPQAMESARSGVRISSMASITPECRPEFEADVRYPTVPFGAALPLEPIDENGRIDGDIIYVADLGEHNEVLRARFGDRAWYRLVFRQSETGELVSAVEPY